MNEYKKLTNEVGAPVADNEHSITAGPRGPVVMQDVWLMEKWHTSIVKLSLNAVCMQKAGSLRQTYRNQ